MSTTAAMSAAPSPPNSGMCSAAVAAISFDCAICGSGSRYMKPMLTTRYTSMTQSVPRISAERQGPLRIAHLPAHEGQIGPAVIRPHDRNQCGGHQRQMQS